MAQAAAAVRAKVGEEVWKGRLGRRGGGEGHTLKPSRYTRERQRLERTVREMAQLLGEMQALDPHLARLRSRSRSRRGAAGSSTTGGWR
jgi:hypothetical protein